MRLNKKKLLLAFVCLVSIVLAYWTASVIAETYFFDKFFYKKSAMYGYQLYGLDLLNKQNNQLIEKRIKDLRQLTQAELNKDLNVLGASSEDVYKIAIIGDSFAYGTGVRQADRYPDRLEKLLNQVKPTKVYVLALPGDNILEHYAKYKLAQENTKPDLYIVGITNNDLLINDFIYPNQISLYQKLREDCTLPECEYDLPDRAITIDELIKKVYYPSIDDRCANICYMDNIIKEMVTANILFFNFFRIESSSPTQILSEADQKDIQIMKKYTDMIRLAGGQVFQLHDSQVLGEYKTVSSMEKHPSAETHDWFAKALFEKIITDNNLGFSHD